VTIVRTAVHANTYLNLIMCTVPSIIQKINH